MSDEAIRRPSFRPIYLHTLDVAHLDGRLNADDHPAWSRLFGALAESRDRLCRDGVGDDACDPRAAFSEALDRLDASFCGTGLKSLHR